MHLLTFTLCLLIPHTQAAQILGLFNHPCKSHLLFFRPLFTELASIGHNVTMVSYFPNEIPMKNYTDLVLSGMPIIADVVDLKGINDRSEIIPYKISTFFMLHGWGMESCEIAFNHPAIKEILNSPIKFDVVILEDFANDCMHAIAYILKIPVMSLNSCALMPWHYRIGNTFLPSFMPMTFLGYTDDMSFIQRLNNFFHFHVVKLMHSYITQPKTNALIHKHFGKTIPPIEQLVKVTSVTLINQYYALTGAYPMTPNVVEVGGLQIQEKTTIPTDLKELLDSSLNGLVFISWGSIVRPETLSKQKLSYVLNTIRKFPKMNFLLKWPKSSSLPDKPVNLYTRDWLPQNAILCHPNVKIFMNHGGLLGLSEAVYCGVPVILTPFYGDQFLNSAAAIKRNLGILVRFSEFTEERLENAIKEILDGRFTQSMKLVSDSYRNRPIKAMDLAIWWVESVIRTKGSLLSQNISNQQSWFITESYDIYICIIIVVVLMIFILKCIILQCIKLIFGRKKQKLKKQ